MSKCPLTFADQTGDVKVAIYIQSDDIKNVLSFFQHVFRGYKNDYHPVDHMVDLMLMSVMQVLGMTRLVSVGSL